MPHILTVPRTEAPFLPESGCWLVPNLDFFKAAVWQSRAQAEQDETWLQPIPYLLLRNTGGQIWCYQRTGGDARLNGRCSCGVGGHVDLQDACHDAISGTLQAAHRSPHRHEFDSYSCRHDNFYKPDLPIDPFATLQHTLLREVAEELGAETADLGQLTLQGLVYEGLSAVGRVHLGVLFTALWLPPKAPQPAAGEALVGLGFQNASAIANNAQYELWSRLAVRHLL